MILKNRLILSLRVLAVAVLCLDYALTLKTVSPHTQMIGVEPAGAASMKAAFENKGVTTLEKIDKFVDGAAVQCVGQHTYEICRKYVDDIVLVPEGKVCTTILDLYNQHAIIAEPAGAFLLPH